MVDLYKAQAWQQTELSSNFVYNAYNSCQDEITLNLDRENEQTE